MNKRGVIDAKEELISVYVLCDPRTDSVRYVGETIDTMKRLRIHRRGFTNKELTRWIKELEGLGLQPTMKVVSTVPRSECYGEEQRLIELYRSQGCLLLNKNKTDKMIEKKVYRSWANCRILWKETGHIFESAAEAGRYFGVTGNTILNNAKRQLKINGMAVVSMPYKTLILSCKCLEWRDLGYGDFHYCPWCGSVLEKKENRL